MTTVSASVRILADSFAAAEVWESAEVVVTEDSGESEEETSPLRLRLRVRDAECGNVDVFGRLAGGHWYAGGAAGFVVGEDAGAPEALALLALLDGAKGLAAPGPRTEEQLMDWTASHSELLDLQTTPGQLVDACPLGQAGKVKEGALAAVVAYDAVADDAAAEDAEREENLHKIEAQEATDTQQRYFCLSGARLYYWDAATSCFGVPSGSILVTACTAHPAGDVGLTLDTGLRTVRLSARHATARDSWLLAIRGAPAPPGPGLAGRESHVGRNYERGDVMFGDRQLVVRSADDTSVSGAGKARTVRLGDCAGRFSVGRDESSDVVLDGAEVSRLHLEFVVDDEDLCWVRDLGSSSGTRVNGEPVETRALRKGDAVQVGRFVLELQVARCTDDGREEGRKE